MSVWVPKERQQSLKSQARPLSEQTVFHLFSLRHKQTKRSRNGSPKPLFEGSSEVSFSRNALFGLNSFARRVNGGKACCIGTRNQTRKREHRSSLNGEG